MTALTLPQRVVARMITGLTRLTTGYAPAGLSEEWIETMGVVGFMRFSVRATKVIGRMVQEYGEVDAQLLASLAAAWNGCGFCGYGHALTASLVWFREHEQLHPLGAEQIAHAMDLRDDESIAYVESRLQGEEHERLRALVRRLHALKMGEAEPQDGDDELLTAAVWLWSWTVECTITLGLTIEPDEAQPYGHPIYKDRSLRERYEQALAASKH